MSRYSALTRLFYSGHDRTRISSNISTLLPAAKAIEFNDKKAINILISHMNEKFAIKKVFIMILFPVFLLFACFFSRSLSVFPYLSLPSLSLSLSVSLSFSFVFALSFSLCRFCSSSLVLSIIFNNSFLSQPVGTDVDVIDWLNALVLEIQASVSHNIEQAMVSCSLDVSPINRSSWLLNSSFSTGESCFNQEILSYQLQAPKFVKFEPLECKAMIQRITGGSPSNMLIFYF